MVRAGAEGLLLAGDGVSGTLAVVATLASGWWDEVDRSERWQRGIFYSLCAAYSLVSLVSLLQLIRLQLRVQQMTIQKIFHFMNFVVNGLRAVLFGLYHGVFLIRPKALEMVVLDLPGLLFFSTYTLLILFWANIYHQVRGLPSTSLRPAYLIINGAIYLIQVGIWVYVLMYPGSTSLEVAKLFFAVISFVAALGFGIYGGRLFVLLRNSAVETRSLQKKVIEPRALSIVQGRAVGVTHYLLGGIATTWAFFLARIIAVGCVTAICCTCFLIRCITVAISAVHEQADLDVLGHPLLNLIYYMLVEIVPSALVLFILWKLPARRSRHHHPIS